MYTYVLIMMILGWVSFAISMAALGLGIQPKPRTQGNIAFSAVVGLIATLWATYLIIGGHQ